MNIKNIKVAIVHDVFVEFGGAERVLTVLLEMYPHADVFIPLFNNEKFSFLRKKTSGHVCGSVFNKIPFVHKASILLKPFLYFYFENLDLTAYDLVISSSHSFSSKAVLTSPNTLHVSYIHTPPRYLYCEYNETQILRKKIFKIILAPFLSWLRQKDFLAAQRPDILIANSKEVQKRIRKYYRRDSFLIYPPVSIKNRPLLHEKKSYYLCHSRLAKQKGVDLAIQAFNKLGEYLVIIGKGSEKKYLESIAKENINFVGFVSDRDLIKFYAQAKAVVNCAREEDFGMATVEALFFGVPVIAFASGGTKEIVNSKTGVLFKDYKESSLIKAIEKFEKLEFKTKDCIRQAKKFSKDRFKKSLSKIINKNL